jgi:hypothetical protein
MARYNSSTVSPELFYTASKSLNNSFLHLIMGCVAMSLLIFIHYDMRNSNS